MTLEKKLQKRRLNSWGIRLTLAIEGRRMSRFGWLHLTDLHQGMTSQDWLWPNLQLSFFEDLTRLHDVCGPWDVIFFTGDLTQRATAAEFSRGRSRSSRCTACSPTGVRCVAAVEPKYIDARECDESRCGGRSRSSRRSAVMGARN